MGTVHAPVMKQRKLVAQIAAVALLYYGGARLGLLLAFANTNVTPVWPPAGIALAGLLLLGWRVWPGVWLGAFAANMAVFSQNHVAGSWTILCVSVVIACGNTFAALAGWCLCDRWLGRNADGSVRLDRHFLFARMSVFQFAALALAAGLASALIGPLAVCVAQIGSWDAYVRVFFTWWSGDATGILYITPFLLSIAHASGERWEALSWFSDHRGPQRSSSQPRPYRWRPLRRETAMAFAALGLTCWAVFGRPDAVHFQAQDLKFLSIAPLLWIAVRVGLRGTAIGLMVLATFVVGSARRQFGVLNDSTELDVMLVRLAFLWVVGLMSLTLASIVTAHRQAVAALRDANAALQATMDAIPAMVCVAHDPQCRQITGNARAYEMLRVPAGGNLSKTPPAEDDPIGFEVRVDGAPIPLEELAMQKAAATGRPVLGQEQELIFPDGDVRFIYGNTMPLLDDNGLARGCVAAFVDATERRRTEEALRESEARFRTLAELVPVFIYSITLDGRKEYANQRFRDYTGLTEQQTADGGWMSFVHPEDLESVRENWDAGPRKGRSEQSVRRSFPLHGTRFFLHQSGLPRCSALLGRERLSWASLCKKGRGPPETAPARGHRRSNPYGCGFERRSFQPETVYCSDSEDCSTSFLL